MYIEYYDFTKKELINSIVGNQVALISDNVERDIAKISNLFYRHKTKNEIYKIPKPIIGNNFESSNNSLIDNGVIIGNNFSIDSAFKSLVLLGSFLNLLDDIIL